MPNTERHPRASVGRDPRLQEHHKSTTNKQDDAPPVVDVYVPGLLVCGAERRLLPVERVAGAAFAVLGVAPSPLLDVHHVFGLVGGAVLRHLAGAPVHRVLRTPSALTSATAAAAARRRERG